MVHVCPEVSNPKPRAASTPWNFPLMVHVCSLNLHRPELHQCYPWSLPFETCLTPSILVSCFEITTESVLSCLPPDVPFLSGGAVTFIKFPHLYLFHIFLTNYVSTELSLSHIFLGHRLFQRSLHCHSNSNSWHHPHQKHPGNLQLKFTFCNSFFTDCQLLFRYPVYLEIKFDRGGEMHLVYCAFKVLPEPLWSSLKGVLILSDI